MANEAAKLNELQAIASLESQLRQFDSQKALAFFIVNDIKPVFNFKQCLLYRKRGTHFEVLNASSISHVNREAHLIQFIEKKLLPALSKQYQNSPVLLQSKSLSDYYDDEEEVKPNALYYAPMSDFEGEHHYGLLFFLHVPWHETLCQTYQTFHQAIAHAWYALLYQRKKRQHRHHFKWRYLLIFLIALMFLPIKQTVLAPGEISIKDPLIVAPSIDGAVKDILVSPNQHVKKGQVLVTLDSIAYQSHVEQAQKELQLQQERLRRAHQHAYLSDKSKAQILLIHQEIAKAKNTLRYAKSLLARTKIRAMSDGIVVFSDKAQWLGKPVRIGERIMWLAKPNEKQLSIYIPIDDLIPTDKAAQVVFYPHPTPLNAIDGKIRYISRVPQNENDLLSYYAIADLKGNTAVHIGVKGTVKIYGETVFLGYYLYRRPLSFIRRYLWL